jgi:hypothetical protein
VLGKAYLIEAACHINGWGGILDSGINNHRLKDRIKSISRTTCLSGLVIIWWWSFASNHPMVIICWSLSDGRLPIIIYWSPCDGDNRRVIICQYHLLATIWLFDGRNHLPVNDLLDSWYDPYWSPSGVMLEWNKFGTLIHQSNWFQRTNLVNFHSFSYPIQGLLVRDLEPKVYELLKPNMTVIKRQFCFLATTAERERERDGNFNTSILSY